MDALTSTFARTRRASSSRLSLLADAVVGDSVTITSNQPATVRHGRIVERLDDHERGEFFVVSLD